jgi:hypothetical protein
MFEVGELCVHKGYICRVETVDRNIANGLYGVKDGTEFNPMLTITPLIGPGGNSAKAASKKRVSSGAVNTIAEAEKEIHDQIQKLQERLILLNLRKP